PVAGKATGEARHLSVLHELGTHHAAQPLAAHGTAAQPATTARAQETPGPAGAHETLAALLDVLDLRLDVFGELLDELLVLHGDGQKLFQSIHDLIRIHDIASYLSCLDL